MTVSKTLKDYSSTQLSHLLTTVYNTNNISIKDEKLLLSSTSPTVRRTFK